MNLLQHELADNASELVLMITEKVTWSYVLEEMLQARLCEAGHLEFQNCLNARLLSRLLHERFLLKFNYILNVLFNNPGRF
jgi:hypothetical protein